MTALQYKIHCMMESSKAPVRKKDVAESVGHRFTDAAWKGMVAGGRIRRTKCKRFVLITSDVGRRLSMAGALA